MGPAFFLSQRDEKMDRDKTACVANSGGHGWSHVSIIPQEGSEPPALRTQPWSAALGVSEEEPGPGTQDLVGPRAWRFAPASQIITSRAFASALGFYASIMLSHFMWDYVLCVPKSS